MLETGLYKKLRDDAGVSTWVSGRIFYSRMPKDATLPAIVFNVVSTTDMGYTFQGASGLRTKRIQFDSYAKAYLDTISISDSIRTILESYSGTLEDGTVVQGCIVISEMDFPYEPGSGGYIQRRMMEVDVIYVDS